MACFAHGLKSAKTLRLVTSYSSGCEFQLLIHSRMGAESIPRSIYSYSRRGFCWKRQNSLANSTIRMTRGELRSSPVAKSTRHVVVTNVQELEPKISTWFHNRLPTWFQSLEHFFASSSYQYGPLLILSKTCELYTTQIPATAWTIQSLEKPVLDVMNLPIPGIFCCFPRDSVGTKDGFLYIMDNGSISQS